MLHLPSIAFLPSPAPHAAPKEAKPPALAFVPMSGRHAHGVALIEAATRSRPWGEPRILMIPYAERHHVNVAILGDRKVVGYVVHESDMGLVRFHDFATDPDYARRGIMTTFLSCLVEQATASGRNVIEARVPEAMLPACLLLRKLGFVVEMPGGIRPGGKDAFEPGDVLVFRKRLDGGECWGK